MHCAQSLNYGIYWKCQCGGLYNEQEPSELTIAVFVAASLVINAERGNDRGFYLGAHIGGGEQKNKIVDESISGTGLLSIKAGYDFNKYIGLEGRYGGVDSSSSEIDLDNFTSLYAKPQYFFIDALSIYALLGVSWTPVALDNGLFNEKETLNSFSYGLGLGWFVIEHLRLSAEYTRISTHEEFTLDAFSLGIDWRF